MVFWFFWEEFVSGDGLEFDELLIGWDFGEVWILEMFFNGFKGGNFFLCFFFKVCWEGVFVDIGVKYWICWFLEFEVVGGGDVNVLMLEVYVVFWFFWKGLVSGDGKEFGELLIGWVFGEVWIVEWFFNGFKDGNFCLFFFFVDDCIL